MNLEGLIASYMPSFSKQEYTNIMLCIKTASTVQYFASSLQGEVRNDQPAD